MSDSVSEAAKEILTQIAECVQAGKSDAAADIPRGSKGRPGVAEYVEQAIARKVPAQAILTEGLMAGLQVIGRKFAANEVFIPEVLISARAMHAGMGKLKPLFAGQDLPNRGVLVIGTVRGDLHDIGKNLVGMLFEGAGYKVVDLGVDCGPEKFLGAVEEHPGCVVGLSALLTTTMTAMRDTVQAIRERSPKTITIIGGAPVTDAFAREIGASGYAPDPATAITVVDRLRPAA